MKVLVTGGAGFIGSHIVRWLLEKGHSVIVADNLSSGSADNLEEVKNCVDFRLLDISNRKQATDAVKDAEAVIHHAAIASVPKSVDDPEENNDVNLGGTLHLLEASRLAGLRRFVFAGSSAVYGDDETTPKLETHLPRPLSPYAVAKLASEYYCKVYYELYGLPTISFRYFNVFGPRQDPNSDYAAVIPIFVSRLLDGRPVTIHGDGEQTRDFVYVDNVAHINLLALETQQGFGQAYNVGCGGKTTLNDLYNMLASAAGSDAKATHGEPRPGDVRHSQADISKASSILGYKPVVSLEEGLRRTVDWYRAQNA